MPFRFATGNFSISPMKKRSGLSYAGKTNMLPPEKQTTMKKLNNLFALFENKLQVSRLENIFTLLQLTPRRADSKIAGCLIEHTQGLVSKSNPEFVADAALDRKSTRLNSS